MVRTALVALAVAGGTYGPFTWPTSVAVAPGGSVLVVENGTGQVKEVDAKGHLSVVASGLTKAYAIAVAPSGASTSPRTAACSHSETARAHRCPAQAGTSGRSP